HCGDRAIVGTVAGGSDWEIGTRLSFDLDQCIFAKTASYEVRRIQDGIQSCPSAEAAQMILDLDSWEAGYYDALLGRPSQCTASLERVSSARGYSQPQAYGAEVQGAFRLRYPKRSRAGSAPLIII